MKVAGCQHFALALPPGKPIVLVSVSGSVDTRAIAGPEGLSE